MNTNLDNVSSGATSKNNTKTTSLEDLSDEVAKIKTDLSYSVKNHTHAINTAKAKLEFLENMIKASIEKPDAILEQIKAIADHLSEMNNHLINNFQKHDKKLDKVDDKINNS